MVFKIAALLVLAATAKTSTTGNSTQWIYDSGPNKGYLCALMQKDGPFYQVYVPSVSPEAGLLSPKSTAMLPVPWQKFATEAEAKKAIEDYCPTQ